jgi:hypothetical protein
MSWKTEHTAGDAIGWAVDASLPTPDRVTDSKVINMLDAIIDKFEGIDMDGASGAERFFRVAFETEQLALEAARYVLAAYGPTDNGYIHVYEWPQENEEFTKIL